MIAYNEQELLYLYHLGSSIAYKLLLDEYKNKIEIFVKRYCRETALTSAEDYSHGGHWAGNCRELAVS